jgi:hypothetical protein
MDFYWTTWREGVLFFLPALDLENVLVLCLGGVMVPVFQVNVFSLALSYSPLSLPLSRSSGCDAQFRQRYQDEDAAGGGRKAEESGTREGNTATKQMRASTAVAPGGPAERHWGGVSAAAGFDYYGDLGVKNSCVETRDCFSCGCCFC